jgi:hypothetical protein
VSHIQNAGFGLFTLRERQAGEVICDYGGEVLQQADIDQRYGPGDQTLAPFAFEAHPFFIDAACSRGPGCYANHADLPAQANAELITEWPQANHPIVRVRATQYIAANSEVYIDYGEQYWQGNDPEISVTNRWRVRNL